MLEKTVYKYVTFLCPIAKLTKIMNTNKYTRKKTLLLHDVNTFYNGLKSLLAFATQYYKRAVFNL